MEYFYFICTGTFTEIKDLNTSSTTAHYNLCTKQIVAVKGTPPLSETHPSANELLGCAPVWRQGEKITVQLELNMLIAKHKTLP